LKRREVNIGGSADRVLKKEFANEFFAFAT
jgi:hypothetical protein